MTDLELIEKYDRWIADCRHYGPEAERLPLGVMVADLKRFVAMGKRALVLERLFAESQEKGDANGKR